jgi:hypothetical protein
LSQSPLTDPLSQYTPYQLHGVVVASQSVEVVQPDPLVLSYNATKASHSSWGMSVWVVQMGGAVTFNVTAVVCGEPVAGAAAETVIVAL